MRRIEGSAYGDQIAGVYDDLYANRGDEIDVVAFLQAVAGERSCLELGIGTGRIAIPLARTAKAVAGIDASIRMLEALADNARVEEVVVEAIHQDMADFSVGTRTFGLIYATMSGLFQLGTRERQVSCLAAVARHLDLDGRFVFDGWVPDQGAFDLEPLIAVVDRSGDRLLWRVLRHDRSRQLLSHHLVLWTGTGGGIYPRMDRYLFPGELDDIAASVGLVLVERWEDHRRAPFTASSRTHVSVYRKAQEEDVHSGS